MAYLRDTAEAWSRLFLYESRDQTMRLFLEKHDRETNAQKAREINSAFAQGREYFTAAAGAGELVSPLLQYYGVLALARGMILFSRAEARERSLPPSHGIQLLGWDGLEAGDASRLDTLRLRFTGGTFGDLAATTKNRCLQWLDSEMPGTWIGGAILMNTARELPSSGSEVVVKDLLRRIPALTALCHEIFEEGSACHYADTRLNVDGTIAKVVLTSRRSDRSELTTHMSRLGFGDNAVVKEVADPIHFGREPHLVIEVSGTDRRAVLASLPQTQRLPGTVGMGETMYLIEPYSPRQRLSPLLTVFALSYFLGMMVRYHPSVWRTQLNREKGDFLYPAFRAASTVIRADYPRLILDELEN